MSFLLAIFGTSYITRFRFLQLKKHPRANALLDTNFNFFKEEEIIQFISNVVNSGDLKPDEFNMIAAGCGSGKTYWVLNHLLKAFPDVKPYEVAFFTSRAITKDQQARNRGTTKYIGDGGNVLPFWNDETKNDYLLLSGYGIQLMTYDQMIEVINSSVRSGHEVLQNLKIVIFDECHVIFSDKFIDGMNDLRIWSREVIYGARKLFIGLTATPRIIDYYSHVWGVTINRINKEVIAGYRAKQMICTNMETIPYLISTNRLPGKTIVMCNGYDDCLKVASQLSNAAIMVSKHSENFTREMKRIRDQIVQHDELPPTFFDADGNERELEVLAATSTLREGFNLRESSGVRNVICCITDELHITQFAGRCRYNIDNLVIAESYMRNDNRTQSQYLVQSRMQFRDYMKNNSCIAWFNPLKHLVDHDVYEIKKFVLGTDENRFINFINGKWLMPKGIDKNLRQNYLLWRDADKNEIVELAIDCKLFSVAESKVSFIRVMKLMQGCLGYIVESGRSVLDGEQHTYKLVVDYNPDQSSYDPPFETIIEDDKNKV